jgi:polyisoprenoid-binding protein YceI
MKKIIVPIIFLFAFITINAQKYITKNGHIDFYSHTSIEDIKADNNQVASILDISSGEIVFQVLMKSFHFERSLMEEHFNENYVESEKYPKSTFTGSITDLESVDFQKKGKYEVMVKGELSMHGESKEISSKGFIEVTDNGIIASSKFIIKPEDYNISIPGVVREKIAKEIEVSINMKYTAM